MKKWSGSGGNMPFRKSTAGARINGMNAQVQAVNLLLHTNQKASNWQFEALTERVYKI